MGSYVAPTADKILNSLDLADFLSVSPGSGGSETPGVGNIGGIFG